MTVMTPRQQAYSLFILFISIFSIALIGVITLIPISPENLKIIEYLDYVICAIFFIDFLVTLARAENKRKYFITWDGLISYQASLLYTFSGIFDLREFSELAGYYGGLELGKY